MGMKLSFTEGYNKCFGCGQGNPIGLKLCFHREDGKAVAQFVPGEFHQGWEGILHGGVMSAALDEAIGYAAWYEGLKTVTAKMEIRFKCPVKIGRKLLLTAELVRKTRKLAWAKATATFDDGTAAAKALATLYIASDGELAS